MSGIMQSGDRRVTIEELRQRAARAANGLASMGVKDEGVVAVMLRNDLAFAETMLATSYLGAYFVPINWHFKADELNFILDDARVTHLVMHADLIHDLGDRVSRAILISVPTPAEICSAYKIAPEKASSPGGCVEWEDLVRCHPAWLDRSRPSRRMMYSSGTTGRPKGIVRDAVSRESQRMLVELNQRWFGHRHDMRTAIIGPLYHSVQTSYLSSAMQVDATVLLMPKFDAVMVLQLIDEQKLTHIHLVPTMMVRLLNLSEEIRQRYDLSSLEFVIHGAAPCSPDIKRMMIHWWGSVIHEYYGTSEAGMVSRCNSQEWLDRQGTVGKALPDRTVRIYDDNGDTLPPNVPGHVYMSLGNVPNFTYQNASEERAKIERDGLITNGDIGYLDEDGYLFICDRKCDMIISGGANLYPAEIEAVLVTHPAILDCAIVGIPDDEFGEIPLAVVQLRNGETVSAEELTAFLSTRIAIFKVPRKFEFRASLQRDDSGKLSKRALRDPYWAKSGRRI